MSLLFRIFATLNQEQKTINVYEEDYDFAGRHTDDGHWR